MAEAMGRAALADVPGWDTCSAGLAAGYGMPASREAVEVMRERGLDLASHSSRPLGAALVDAAELIIVMTEAHRAEVEALYPAAKHKVYLLRGFDPETTVTDIVDPIGMTTDMYRKTCRDIAAALPGLVKYVRECGE
jgi:protein-tyrosine-phosphatase